MKKKKKKTIGLIFKIFQGSATESQKILKICCGKIARNEYLFFFEKSLNMSTYFGEITSEHGYGS